jgi:hypothetical protein
MISISIGQFPPMSKAIIKFSYFQKVDYEDMSYCLRVPEAYVPRYIGDLARAVRDLYPDIKDDAEMLEEEKDELLHEMKQMAHYAHCLPWNITVSA